MTTDEKLCASISIFCLVLAIVLITANLVQAYERSKDRVAVICAQTRAYYDVDNPGRCR